MDDDLELSMHWFWAVPATLLGTALVFEQLRYIITTPTRKKQLRQRWRRIGGDYVISPLARLMSLFSPHSSTGWETKIYDSLKVAGRFVNPFIEWEDKLTANIFGYLRWQLTRTNRNGKPTKKELDINLPLDVPNFDLLFKSQERKTLSESWITEEQSMNITWIGQSTCFIQMDGYNILTDPIFSSRTMGEWFGPKRLRPVPCLLKDLPPVDIVLVSHNHPDHLDPKVIVEIGNSATWYVPLGLKAFFASYGVTRVVELDWWQEVVHEKLQIISCPLQHWSGRNFFDVNSTLWCSFVVKGKSTTNSFFHCGDSGYCSVFKEIGDRHGPFTFAAIRTKMFNGSHWFV